MSGGRISNDHSFECNNLKGMVLESLFGFYDGKDPKGMDILIVKLKGVELWQRFFLHSGLGFWEEYDRESAFEDYDDLIPINIAAMYKLTDQVVKNMSCTGNDKELSKIQVEIGSIIFTLKHKNSKNLDSETVLEKL